MAKDPSFPWYASDWLGSNTRALMSLEQQGAYMNLLCRQWSDETCSLPDDDVVLARLSELHEGWLKGGSGVLRPKFPPHPTLEGRLANPRLLAVRAERSEWRSKSAAGGRKSGEIRRAKAEENSTSDGLKSAKANLKGGSTTKATKREPNANTPSPSPSITPVSPLEGTEGEEGAKPKKPKERKKPNEDYSEAFEEFWSAYPSLRKQGKRAAWQSWQKAIKRTMPLLILQAVREFAASPKGQGNSPAPTVWLNQNRWEDDPEAWQQSGEDEYSRHNPHPPVDGPCPEY